MLLSEVGEPIYLHDRFFPGAGDRAPAPRLLAGAVAGVLAAGAAIGMAQFAAGLGVPQSSPVLAVGQAAIDLAPPGVKDFAVSAFGADDKTVLLGGILVLLALYAVAVGILAVHRIAVGLGGLAVFAALGLAAALTRPTATVGYVVPTLAGAVAGAIALTFLARAAAALGSTPGCAGPEVPARGTPAADAWTPGHPGQYTTRSAVRPGRPTRSRPGVGRTARNDHAGPRGGDSWPTAARRPVSPRSGAWPDAIWPANTTSPRRGTHCGSPGLRSPRHRCRAAAASASTGSARLSPRTRASTGSTPPCSCPRSPRPAGSCGSTEWCSGK